MFSISFIDIFLISLLYVHISFACYSFAHRSQMHKAVEFANSVTRVFEFWLWLTIGVFNRYRIASHIVHHRYTDKEKDPHSPTVSGIFNMLVKKPVLRFLSVLFYPFFKIKFNQTNYENLKPYLNPVEDTGYVYKYAVYGPFVFCLINLILFGLNGFFLFLVFGIMSNVAGFTIGDGLTHLYGYRNYSLDKDNKSSNIIPFGILLAGEELHNNHHAAASGAKFSHRWFEFDMGWCYITILQFLKLAKVIRKH